MTEYRDGYLEDNLYDGEIFVPIEDFESSYLVSNKGRIYGIKNKRFRKISISKNGYREISLTKGRKFKKTLKLHRLIAINFIDNPNNHVVVNHIDGDKLNNEISNLEWCTYQENIIHAYKNNLIDKSKLKQSHLKWIIEMNKKRAKPVLQIDPFTNEVIREWRSSLEANQYFSIYKGDIGKCCRGIQKIAGGYKWKYKNDDGTGVYKAVGREAYLKKVYQFDLNGNLITTFNSLADASCESEISVQTLSYSIRKGNVKNNYIWKYEEQLQ